MNKNNAEINIGEFSRGALADNKLRENLRKATSTALIKRDEAVKISGPSFERSRERAIAERNVSICSLRELTARFCKNAEARGVRTFVFDDYVSALNEITKIIKEKGAGYVVKSKSMISEEIGLNDHLRANGIEPVETDLGEFIVSLAGESPSHLTAPALHKSRRDVAELFAAKLGVKYTENVEELAMIARKYLREKFLDAKIGISGANFAAADNGVISIVENECNARLSFGYPQTHIAVFGAEKIISRFNEMGSFLDILSKSATGQIANAYTSFVGACEEGHERYFIIITKNRYKIADDPVFSEALRCVRCGACQNICPIFQRISGHGYGFTYAGPIGIALAPFFLGYEKCSELIEASTLCGFCKKICPVKIDIPSLILEHRRRYYEDPSIVKTPFKKAKKIFSYIHSKIMSGPFLSSLIPPFIRLYFKASKYLGGRNYIPLWDKYEKRHFMDMPEKTFMERYFKK